ncbi:site-specific integrase [Spirosoma validum]|uniref:Phage integrase SAM-like domain-containing protein n=1 Tax=Spirosoma validum TaxID=2771355 RepID=A0A927GH05_9BACT|nr:phage integrase SAM-like domain-containing protein [Spirosoma validum]MBD2757165.1 phage integrase SAM-like domain-containing protein [Spirosoma validum]
MSNQPAYYSIHRVRFEFRKSRATDSLYEKGSIYAYIKVEGQGIERTATGIRATREDWKNRTAPRQSQAAKELNEQLVLWENSIKSAARTLTERGEPITAQELMAEKSYAKQPLLTIEEVMDKYIAYKKQLIDPDEAIRREPGQISFTTFRTYGIRRKWLSQYLKAKHNPKLPIHKVDAQFVEAYHFYLKCLPQMGTAFASKCAKLLTEVYNWAKLTGLIRTYHTLGFRGASGAEKPPYNLTEEEVCRIEALAYLTPDQMKVRDGWLLARELCLHHSDYKALRVEHFSRDSHGRLILEKYRTKQEAGRGIKIVCYVSARAERIWNRYGQKISTRRSDVHIGRVLKEIGKSAELDRPLTFGHARDSGIFRLVAAGCSDAQIKMAAGWTSTKQLIRYVNHDRRLLEAMANPMDPAPEQRAPEPTRHPFIQIHRTA